MSQIAAVVLAGGKGTRMKSDTHKVLHKVGDKPIIVRNIEKLYSIGIQDLYIVVGHQAEAVKDQLKEFPNLIFCYQEEPLGTGHALQTAVKYINKEYHQIFVLNGDDAALYSNQTLHHFINSHCDAKAAVSMMTLIAAEPNELGRIIRDENGNFIKSLEIYEYQNSGYSSNEVNAGVYIYDYNWLQNNISNLKTNQKGEYPITDLLMMANQQGENINLFLLKNTNEWAAVNTLEELEVANSLLKSQGL